eukprot:jgi/Astpho2/2019/Aster-00520
MAVCVAQPRQQMFQPPPALDDSQSLLALLAQGRSSAAPALSPAQAGALKALTHSPAASQAAGFRKSNKSTLAKPSNMPANCPPSQHTMSGSQSVGSSTRGNKNRTTSPNSGSTRRASADVKRSGPAAWAGPAFSVAPAPEAVPMPSAALLCSSSSAARGRVPAGRSASGRLTALCGRSL